jgi:hypothetical protein
MSDARQHRRGSWCPAWKMCQAQKRNENVGYYVTFIDTESYYSGIWKGKKETKGQDNAISTVYYEK